MGNFSLPKLAVDVTEHPDLYTGALGEVTFDAARKVASTHDAETPGGIALLPANHTGRGNIACAPVSNRGVTKTSFVLEAETQPENANYREFMVALGMVNNRGQGNGIGADKVTLYLGHDLNQGGSDGWSLNTVLHYNTTFGVNARGYELDTDMLSGMKFGYGLGPGASLANGVKADGTPIGNVSAWAMTITGIATTPGARFTGGLLIGGVTDLYNHGLVFSRGGITTSILDCDVSQTFMLLAGGHALDGINTEAGQFGLSVLNVGEDQLITCRSTSAGGAIRRHMLSMDAVGAIHIGDNNVVGSPVAAATDVYIGGGAWFPVADNQTDAGGPGRRMRSIWAANGTIQTSDPTKKDNLADLPVEQSRQFMRMVAGKSFTWKEGGRTPVITPTMKLQPVKIQVPETRNKSEIVDGKMVITPETIMVDAFEEETHEAFNADGSPRFIEVAETALRPVKQKDGTYKEEMVRTGAMLMRRDVVTTTKMAMQPYDEVSYEPVPGIRLHNGFDASEVQRAIGVDGIDRDFGGFVVDEDGSLALRPDQMIPFVWTVVRDLMDREERQADQILDLSARLDAFERAA